MRFDNHFGWSNAGKFLLEGEFRLGGTELCHGEFAGSDIDVGDANGIASSDDTREEVVALGSQHGGVNDGAGRDDADHFAVNQPFGEGRIACLFADGDAVTLAD